MPDLTANFAFDMRRLPSIYLPVDDASSSRVLDVHLDTYLFDQTYSTGWTIYNGSFTYDANDNIFGTVSSVSIFAGSFRALSTGGFQLNGVLQQSVTGLNKDASIVAGFFGAQNVQGLIAYLFDGADTLTGSNFDDVLDGFAGVDTLFGGGGNDYLYGGSENDTLLGGASTNLADSGVYRLFGDGGNDTLRQVGGVFSGEVFDGGLGTDTLELFQSLTPPQGQFGPQSRYDFHLTTVTSIERVVFGSTAGTQSVAQFGTNQIGTGLSASATLVGSGGNDQVILFAASAGTYTVPSFSLSNWSTPSLGSLQYDAVMLQATGAGNYTLRATQDHAGVQILAGAGGNDTFEGGAGIEFMEGGGGNDTFFGSAGNDRLVGGLGMDIFTFAAGFAGFANGTVQTIDGGEHPDGPTVSVPLQPDLLILPGRANDYTISETATGTTIVDSARGITFNTSGIEQLSFTTGVSNNVTAVSTVLELGRLALDAYNDVGAGRNWHQLSAIELGMLPRSEPDALLQYSMQNGFYTATSDRVGPDSEANALVSVGLINGQRVLSISFRGTDDRGDLLDDFNFLVDDAGFAIHYDQFRPLIEALDAFIGDSDNQISRVIVSGHSLGAAMVQMYLAAPGHPNTATYQGLALATPGPSDSTGDPEYNNILNIVHSDDIVTIGALQPHNGAIITINTPAFRLATAFEHGANLYYADLVDLISHASVAGSPFSTSALGQALAAGTIYVGVDVQVSLSDNDDLTNTTMDTFSGDNFVLGSGADNKISWKDLDATLDNRIIDAGVGLDELRLPGSQADWTWPTTANQHGLLYQGILVGEVWNVERLVFTGSSNSAQAAASGLHSAALQSSFVPVVYLDGTVATAQQALAGAAVLVVDANVDYVMTGTGNIQINGSADDDIIMLEGGNQVVLAGAGDDIINARIAASGAAFAVTGGPGNDLIFGASGTNTIAIFGGLLADYVGKQFADGSLLLVDQRAASPDGGDTLVDVQTLRFADGDISLAAYLAAYVPVVINGTANSDYLSSVDDRSVQLFGLGGGDTLVGSSYADMLNGGSGADQMTGGLGNDSYFADRQDDLVFEDPNGGTDSVTSAASFYLYANIENLTLTGSAGNFGVGNDLANVLTGNAGENLLIAGAGNDEVHGGAARDAIFGQDGADNLFGDGGIDYIVAGTGNDTIDGGANADEIYGQEGDDTIFGGASFDTDIIVGGDGSDTIFGNSGLGDFDFLYGNLGNDTFYVDTPADLVFEQPGEGTDTVYAGINGGGFYLYANIENLILTGNTPFGVGNGLDNSLTGNAIGNYLLGGLGNDTLNGMGGNDVLFGEGGNDTFVFTAGTGGDVIGDFTRGQDKIDISAFGFSFAQAQANFSQVGGNGAINLGNGDFIVLNGVTMSQLTASDFILAPAAVALKVNAPVMELPDSWDNAFGRAFLPDATLYGSDGMLDRMPMHSEILV